MSILFPEGLIKLIFEYNVSNEIYIVQGKYDLSDVKIVSSYKQALDIFDNKIKEKYKDNQILINVELNYTYPEPGDYREYSYRLFDNNSPFPYKFISNLYISQIQYNITSISYGSALHEFEFYNIIRTTKSES